MNDQEISVSFSPNLNAIQCALPFGIFYGTGLEKISGIVFSHTLAGHPHVLIDENVTEEVAQDTIKWARDVLEKGVPPL